MRVSRFLVALALLLALDAARAGDSHLTTSFQSDDGYQPGTMEVELLGGAVWSWEAKRYAPTVGTSLFTLRWGTMLTTPRISGWFPGNTEFLVEGFGGGIFSGPGNYISGINLALRRNLFFGGQTTVVPYAQLNAGGSYSDIDQDMRYAILGSDLNFSAGGALGLRLNLWHHGAILIEHDFHHFSNAGTTHRNHGIDFLGGQGGVSFSF